MISTEPNFAVAAISLLIPLFAGIVAYAFLGEKLSSTILPGGLLVLAGIVTILRQNHQSNAGRRYQTDIADPLEILETPPLAERRV